MKIEGNKIIIAGDILMTKAGLCETPLKDCCGCSCHICFNGHETGGRTHTLECSARFWEQHEPAQIPSYDCPIHGLFKGMTDCPRC